MTYRKRKGAYADQPIKYVRCPLVFLSMARKDGYVMEHRLLVAQAIGRPLLRAGSGASQEPQSDGKSTDQPDALCDERGTQGIRAWRGHKTALVRVVPFQYTGKMWCLRVPTGAFVAFRGGVAFPTGNSGFPKSLDVSKAIDKGWRTRRELVWSLAARRTRTYRTVGDTTCKAGNFYKNVNHADW